MVTLHMATPSLYVLISSVPVQTGKIICIICTLVHLVCLLCIVMNVHECVNYMCNVHRVFTNIMHHACTRMDLRISQLLQVPQPAAAILEPAK